MKQDTFEQARRVRTLRIVKLADAEEEDCEEEVVSLSRALKVDISTQDIERAFRVGKFKIGEARPIVVEFSRLKTVKAIMGARSFLKSEDLKDTKFAPVFINEDLTPLRASLRQEGSQWVHQGFLYGVWATGGEVYARQKADSKPVKLISKAHMESLKLEEPIPPDLRDQKRMKKTTPMNEDQDSDQGEDDEENGDDK